VFDGSFLIVGQTVACEWTSRNTQGPARTTAVDGEFHQLFFLGDDLAGGHYFLAVAFDGQHLEIVTLPLDGKAQILEAVGEPGTKWRLEVGCIAFQVAELTGFPTMLFCVER
jgi:hypothetical protein